MVWEKIPRGFFPKIQLNLATIKIIHIFMENKGYD